MRQSGSFSEAEQEWVDTLFRTLLRGGDARDLMRADAAGGVVLKFSLMRMRTRRRVVTKKLGPRCDDATTMTVAGLMGILEMTEIGRMIGVTPNALRCRVRYWRRRMDAKFAAGMIGADDAG